MGTSRAATKRITAEFEGEIYDFTVTEWVNFLKDKNIAYHFTYNTIRTKLTNRDNGNLDHTIKQCLGISESSKKTIPKNKIPMVPKKEIPAYLLAKDFLRKRLTNNGCLISSYCQCGMEKAV